MEIRPIIEEDIAKASDLIGYIDSGEKSLFLEHINLSRKKDFYIAEMFYDRIILVFSSAFRTMEN